MSIVSVGQMVQALSLERTGLASWERDAISRCHAQSCYGLKPWCLNQRQCELIVTIFNRVYQNV